MAAADVPKWGFGQKPMEIKPVANSFVPFFSTCASSRTDANMSWSNNFAVPSPHVRLPAWDRVPTQSHPATGKTRQIMKRVGVCTQKRAPKPFLLLPPLVQVMPVPTREDIALDQYVPRKIRRGPTFKAVTGDSDYSGRASSRAEIVNQFMQAKVDVSNNFMATSSCTTFEDKIAARRGIYQVVPMKRYANNDIVDSPIMLVPTGGNKLSIYNQLIPIIKRALRIGKSEIDLPTASMAEFSTLMRRIRRNPRQHLAAFGASDLSDIMDMAEPESPTVVRQPILKAESRSPQKRLARLTSPIKNGMNRITDGFVKLVPGNGHKAPASPTKADSAPSTPLRQSPTPVKPTVTPTGIESSPISGSPVTAKENLSTESADEGSPRPGRTFRVPSEFDSSSVNDSTQEPPETPKASSPINYSRPIAPTPSQWNRFEPSTPQTFTPLPQNEAPVTPGQTFSPIGLASLVLPSTPKLPACTYDTPTGADSFDFGKASPFRNSISWMNTSVQASEPKRIKNVNQARRRQSEPLLRKYLESQARRRSSSPQKVRYQEEDTFRDDFSIASLFDTACATPLKTAATETAPAETAATEIAATETPVEATPIETTQVETVPTEIAAAETAATETDAMETDAAQISADEDVSMIIESEATHEVPDLTCSTPLDTAATKPVVTESTAAAQTAISETPATETTTDQPIADEDMFIDVAPQATEDVSDTPSATPLKDDATETTAAQPDADEPMPIDIEHAPEAPAPTNNQNGQTATVENGVVNIDMRQNPDIFGTCASSPPAPIYKLSRMANDACDGHAKIVVAEENGRLFVRFKVSAEYAHMFPASQGFDDSQFTTSPLAISSSPRISFKTNQPSFQAQPALSSSPAKVDQTPVTGATRDFLAENSLWVENTPTQKRSPIPEPASVSNMLKTPDFTAFGRSRSSTSGFRTPELPADEHTMVFGSPEGGFTPANKSSVRDSLSVDDILKTPDVTGLGIINTADTSDFQTPELPAHDNTLMFAEPPASARPTSNKRMTRRQSAMTPLKRALTNSMTPLKRGTPNAVSTPKFATPMTDDADRTLAVSWPDVKDTPARQNDEVLTEAATPDQLTPVRKNDEAFTKATPVQANDEVHIEAVTSAQPTPTKGQDEVTSDTPAIMITDATESELTTPGTTTSTRIIDSPEDQASLNNNTPPAQEAQAAPAADARRQEYDSPGREYMREFIKRSRQTTTTETGSPIAPPTKRQPLGARSPNRGSPLKNKRKHEDDSDDVQSPAKKAKADKETKTEIQQQSTPKKGRRTKTSRQKTELEIDMNDLPPTTASSTETTTAPTIDTTDKQVDELDSAGPITRRSTRLRGQDNESGAPKSSIPTPIKLTRAGAGRNGGAVLTSSDSRTKEKELSNKTRANTRKNKGDAEYPAEVLAKFAAAPVEDDSDGSQGSEGSANSQGRRVGWKTPLASIQDEEEEEEKKEKPKKGRAPKGKATQGQTGIAKPKSTTKSTPKAKRTTKVAESLGMVANGTPAKSQRVTRSRARSGA
ncbi:hypothetical protein ACHAPJ_007021 [Fusarium lateritium]